MSKNSTGTNSATNRSGSNRVSDCYSNKSENRTSNKSVNKTSDDRLFYFLHMLSFIFMHSFPV